MDETGRLLAVTSALTDDQRAEILNRFTKVNPHWQGAGAADVLDALDQADSDLDVTEPFFGNHPDLAEIPGAGVALRALIHAGMEISEFALRGLLDRAGLLLHDAAPTKGTMRDFRDIRRWDERAFDYPMTADCRECGRPCRKEAAGEPWEHTS